MYHQQCLSKNIKITIKPQNKELIGSGPTLFDLLFYMLV
uniref:Uncharacterized protein n=1 Tax=Arundo donax TaxID=35708 RepID=A0A0A9FSW4_ARUDO